MANLLENLKQSGGNSWWVPLALWGAGELLGDEFSGKSGKATPPPGYDFYKNTWYGELAPQLIGMEAPRYPYSIDPGLSPTMQQVMGLAQGMMPGAGRGGAMVPGAGMSPGLLPGGMPGGQTPTPNAQTTQAHQASAGGQLGGMYPQLNGPMKAGGMGMRPGGGGGGGGVLGPTSGGLGSLGFAPPPAGGGMLNFGGGGSQPGFSGRGTAYQLVPGQGFSTVPSNPWWQQALQFANTWPGMMATSALAGPLAPALTQGLGALFPGGGRPVEAGALPWNQPLSPWLSGALEGFNRQTPMAGGSGIEDAMRLMLAF
jgi:hypothetical protein